jgi:hypothetical protein
MRTYLLVLACALLLLGQFVLPTAAGPYLEDGGEFLNSFLVCYQSQDTYVEVLKNYSDFWTLILEFEILSDFVW